MVASVLRLLGLLLGVRRLEGTSGLGRLLWTVGLRLLRCRLLLLLRLGRLRLLLMVRVVSCRD